MTHNEFQVTKFNSLIKHVVYAKYKWSQVVTVCVWSDYYTRHNFTETTASTFKLYFQRVSDFQFGEK